MSAHAPIGVGTRLSYDGEIITIVELFPAGCGNQVLVSDRGGSRRYWLTLRELLASGRAAILDAPDGPRSDDPCEIAGVILSNLTDRQQAAVTWKAAHVREVLTGFTSGSAELALPNEPRPEYVPTTPLLSRYMAKSAEIGKDPRTIRRWVQQYREHGEAGLASNRARVFELAPIRGRYDQRWVQAALEVMVDHVRQSRPSEIAVIRDTNARVDVRYGVGVVEKPSRTGAYRALAQLEPLAPLFRKATKRNREIAAKPEPTYTTLHPRRPGEYMAMDTNSLDVYALDQRTLKWVPVELTVLMDWYTRCIVGLRLTPGSTKSIDVAATLYQAFRPNDAPDDWPEYAAWPEHGIPRSVFVEVDALAGKKTGATNPVIIPDTLVIDHGRPFKSAHITSVCQRMGISIQPARLRTAQDKGIVERFFLTLREDLLQLLPGYKGPDVYSRGLEPETEAFFFLDELEEIIRRWVATVYHHRKHSSLFDPHVPGMLLSPAEMFEHGIRQTGFIEAPADPDLAFEFLPVTHRTIQNSGVQINRLRYNGVGLANVPRTSPYGGKANGGWPIHFNPDDISRVYFRNPYTHKWQTLMWQHAASLNVPMSRDALNSLREQASAAGVPFDPNTATDTLLQRLNLDRGTTVTQRRIALRLSRECAALIADLKTEDQAEVENILSTARKMISAPATAESGNADTDVDDADDDTFDDDPYEDFFGEPLEDL